MTEQLKIDLGPVYLRPNHAGGYGKHCKMAQYGPGEEEFYLSEAFYQRGTPGLDA